jgi:hypothetical protein
MAAAAAETLAAAVAEIHNRRPDNDQPRQFTGEKRWSSGRGPSP